jgi:hypothetical protein
MKLQNKYYLKFCETEKKEIKEKVTSEMTYTTFLNDSRAIDINSTLKVMAVKNSDIKSQKKIV